MMWRSFRGDRIGPPGSAFLAVIVVAGCSFSATNVATGDDSPLPSADAAMCSGPDTDGDGTPNACDACPNDKPNDSDGDGVCNSQDICASGPDNVDADADGIPNACDDWPCGPKPAAPNDVVTWFTANENVTLSSISVANQGKLAVVSPGATIAVRANYSIVDCQCPGCIDQIEIGFHTVGKAECLYSGNPNGNGSCLTPQLGMNTRMISAPMTKGVWELRFNRGNDNSCQLNGQWWGPAPSSDRRFAYVCVN